MRKLICGVFAASIAISGLLGGAAAIGATSVQAATPCTAFTVLNHLPCDSISFYNSGVGFNGQTTIDPVPSQSAASSGALFNNNGQKTAQP